MASVRGCGKARLVNGLGGWVANNIQLWLLVEEARLVSHVRIAPLGRLSFWDTSY